MATRLSFVLLAAACVLVIAGCSDDSNPTDNGNPDTTPPTVSSVTPVDAFHFDVTFNENVTRASAEDDGHYVIIEQSTAALARGSWAAAPDDTMHIAAASLNSDQRTVSITTEDSMADLPYELAVRGVKDASGNEINTPVVKTFTGSSEPDVTAPEIVSRSPAPNATGVGIGAPVVIQFSEPVNYDTFASGATWTSPGGPVPFDVQNDGVQFSLVPTAVLSNNTVYTVTLTGVQDPSGNTMPATNWTFTTTNIADTTPPTLVSSSPANLQAGVSVDASLLLTFSEPVNQTQLDPQLAPDPGRGVVTWSGDGKTVTFDPDLSLVDDQQYSLIIAPGGVRDLAGNGSTQLINIRFTTAAAMANGSFAGTISGDPLSNFAGDPTGGFVIALDVPLFGGANPFVAGTGTIAGNDTYKVSYLPDGVYFPAAIMDSNHDGRIEPSLGDAIGAYGVDFGAGDSSVDSVTIVGGADLTGVNFPLYDPSAIAGTVSYTGQYAGDYYNLYIGLFDTSNWDPSDPPVVTTRAFWSNYPEWSFNTFEYVLTDDTYYVGGYLDVNFNGTYESGIDPAGFYGGIPPTSVHFEKGSDVLGIVIPLADPLTTRNSFAVTWPVSANRAPWVRQLSKTIQQAQLGATR